MAKALKAMATLALGSHRGLLSTLKSSRQLDGGDCTRNICGRKLTDAKTCAEFGDHGKDCQGACITGFVASGDDCVIAAVDLKAVDASGIFNTGMTDEAKWTDAADKRKQRKKNARNWFKNAFAAHAGKTENEGKKKMAMRKELRLELDKDEDFSPAAKTKIEQKLSGKKIYMKPGPDNSAQGDTCVVNSAAEDDTCVTTVLGVKGGDVDKNVLGCDEGCWQVGGVRTAAGDLLPIIRQTRASANADYTMACWTGNAWDTGVTKASGEEMTCTVGLHTVEVLVDSMTATGGASVAEYHTDSLVPRGSTSKTFSDDGLSAISASLNMVAAGDDIKVTLTTGVQADASSSYACALSVGVAHDATDTGSDATLRDASLVSLGAAATATTQTDNGDGTYTFTVDVKSSSYQTDANDKLHAGRLGVTLTPVLTCSGALSVTLSQFGTASADGIPLVEANGDAPGHAVHYDLVAQSMIPTDAAETPSGALEAHADDAKRAYPYTAAFTHFHDQVVFPETSIGGKTIEDHFHGLTNPQPAKCAWAVSDYHADLTALQAELKTNLWMADDDAATPSQGYGGWTAPTADCSAGICSKLQQSATVDGAAAYLPFDKPKESYYATQPRVECTSQDGVSDVAASTLTPALASDSAPAMLSALVVKHDTLTKVDCDKNTVDADICLAPTTDKVIGELFTMQDVTDDFDDLLTDTYDFNLAASCSGITGDACTIVDITGADGRVSSKPRADVVGDLGDLAQAVRDTTFALPAAYGTTFSGFQASVSGGTAVTNSTNKYRTDEAFGVTISADRDTLSWTGNDAVAGFQGEGEVDATHGTPAAPTQTRVSDAAVAGYMKAADQRVFTDGEMEPFTFTDSYDPGKTTDPVDSTQCQAATDTVMCKSNGFAPVDCLSRTLTVTYSVTTPTEDDRFPESTAVATKTWHVDGPGSAAQADVGFSVTPPAAQQGIAGIPINAAGSSTDESNVNTVALAVSTGDYMGSDNITFTRNSQAGTMTYNCESAPETITYTASVAAPCGDIAAYEIGSDLEAHYVYSVAQVQQDSTTAHTTTEWHVQESSSAAESYKIEIPIIIENPTNADGNHLPADQVSVAGLSANVGGVTLKACAVNDAGKQECVVEYYNDATYDVSVGKSCGDTNEPACPVISYDLVASKRNGNVVGAFGEASACGAAGAAPDATVISPKILTLTVQGDAQAYDGVIDVHAKVGSDSEKPHPIASEDQHLAAVPGKDAAATTILDLNTDETQDAHIDASKNIAFRVEYLKTGTGARTFQIAPLDVDADTWGEGTHTLNLPSLRVCGATDYNNGECVSGSGGGVDGGSAFDCTDPWVDKDATPLVAKTNCKDEFYVSLGDDVTTDICQNTPVGSDPYTVDGKPYLGFSIQVTYLAGGSGAADSQTPHNYVFALKCPAKEYSLNIASQLGEGSTREVIPEDGNIGLINKSIFAQSHDSEITLNLFFAGRSQDGVKQPLRLVANDDVSLVGGTNGEISGNLIGDKFEDAQPVTFKFERECLFTELHLISQMSDAAADTDKFFKFKLQCPRFQGTSTFDSLNLDYTITGTTFTNDGGSVTVTQPSLANAGGKDFTSITTGLVGTSCSGAINSGCEFGSAAGAQELSGGSTSIAGWFNYLKGCGFTETGGLYTGAVQRTYVRANRIGANSASYCGGRDLSFGVIMTGTHTATLTVESPKEMNFAVEVLELAWQDCDAGSGAATGKNLHAVIELQRQFHGDAAFTLASNDAVTEQVLSGFANAGQVAVHNTTTGTLTVAGQCIANPADAEDCSAFTGQTREINFGIAHTLNGIDYRGDLEVDLALSCPLGELEGSENSAIPMYHTSKCSGYGSTIDTACNTTGGVAQVSADGQIELELVIDDSAFDEHDVSAPTYAIQDGASGNVADLTSEYIANDGTSDISLVQNGGSGEENSKVTLRALALSGQTVTISWDVLRVAQSGNRRMLRQTVSYTLGADGSSTEGAAFVVLPATRDGETDSITATGEALSEAEASAGTTHTHEHHVDDHHEEGSGLLIFGIVGGGLLVTVVLAVMFSGGQREVVYASSPPSGFANRFYRYSKVDDRAMFDRNRFRG